VRGGQLWEPQPGREPGRMVWRTEMNAYEQGIADAMASSISNVATSRDLFWSRHWRETYPKDFLKRKLGTRNIAELMNVDIKTVYVWVQKGWLAGRKISYRKGNLKFKAWRFSLYDLDRAILRIETRKQGRNSVEHKAWTEFEKKQAASGICPEGRTHRAFLTMRCRLKKKGE